ncbi:MAG: phosphatase PAP2 family protein [Candidatus Bathyarchaeia archaeon]
MEEKRNFKAYIQVLIVCLFLVLIAVIEEVYLENYYVKKFIDFPYELSKIDLALFPFINKGLTSYPLDVFFGIVTHIGSTIFWLIFSIMLWARNKKNEAILLAIAIIIGGIVLLPIKLFLPRARPYQVMNEVRTLDIEWGSSFPSGHAKNAFSAAVILSDKYPKWRLVSYALAIVVSFSRIYVGVHWPMDVVVGAFVGWALGIMVLRLEKRILGCLNILKFDL